MTNVFTRDELLISKPQRTLRTFGGTLTITVKAPFKVTIPENWNRLSAPDHISANIVAHIDRQRSKITNPVKKNPVWSVYGGKSHLTCCAFISGLTYPEALEIAKNFVMAAN